MNAVDALSFRLMQQGNICEALVPRGCGRLATRWPSRPGAGGRVFSVELCVLATAAGGPPLNEREATFWAKTNLTNSLLNFFPGTKVSLTNCLLNLNLGLLNWWSAGLINFQMISKCV